MSQLILTGLVTAVHEKLKNGNSLTLWPKELKAFKMVCEPNEVNNITGSLTIKIPNVGRPMKMSDDFKALILTIFINVYSGFLTIKITHKVKPSKMSDVNVSSSSLNIRKPVDNSKSKISKIIINSVPNASDSNISDGVKTKELDKSFAFSNLVSCISEIYSVDINKDSSGEANSTLRAKSSNLKYP